MAYLLVVVNWEDRIVRVYRNTAEARAALNAWRTLDAAYVRGEVSDTHYLSFTEYMEAADIDGYTTQTESQEA
jgi:hypothetical protein